MNESGTVEPARRAASARGFICVLLVSCLGLGLGCRADTRSNEDEAGVGRERNASGDAGTNGWQAPEFCSRQNKDQDGVRDVFCGAEDPEIRGLSDLQRLLEVNPHAASRGTFVGDPLLDNPHSAVGSVSVMSHSTSLSGSLVSPINPRVIILGQDNIMAFTRGVQRVELIATSRVTSKLNFYMVSFEQACNTAADGCKPGDLYTPRVESDWLRVRVQDDEMLKNTALDCRQCHQRNADEPILLMRELEGPWTHFFLPSNLEDTNPGVDGTDLMDDFLAAKGDEVYAGYDLSTISAVVPFLMQMRVGTVQPLFFDVRAILGERFPSGDQSAEAHPSSTWEAAYEAFKRGEQLALPYLDMRATDLDKQRERTEDYRRFREGELAADELPDLANIYPDDPKLRARMGLQTEPDASAQDVLIQACGSCHNDVLDQSLSRARFNIDVSRMQRKELDLAIERVQRDHAKPGAMPPPEARQLDDQARERLVAYLRDTDGAATLDPKLERAAQMGMSGGGATILQTF